MQSLLLHLLGLGVGVGLVVQVGMNSTLRALLGSPIVAALISFLVGSLALAAVCVPGARTPLAGARAAGRRARLGVARRACSAPSTSPRAWSWDRGSARRRLLALVVLGQLVTSLLVDHFGWLGFPQHPLTVVRVLGRGAAVRRRAADRALDGAWPAAARAVRNSASAAAGSRACRQRPALRRRAASVGRHLRRGRRAAR